MKYDSEDPRITAYVFGELDDKELAEFESQLAANEELQHIVEQTRETLVALENELGGEPAPALSGQQREDIERAISTSAPDTAALAAAPTKPHASTAKETLSTGRGARFWAAIAGIEAVAIALGAVIFFPAAFGQPGGRTAMAPPQPASDAPMDAADDLGFASGSSSMRHDAPATSASSGDGDAGATPPAPAAEPFAIGNREAKGFGDQSVASNRQDSSSTLEAARAVTTKPDSSAPTNGSGSAPGGGAPTANSSQPQATPAPQPQPGSPPTSLWSAKPGGASSFQSAGPPGGSYGRAARGGAVTLAMPGGANGPGAAYGGAPGYAGGATYAIPNNSKVGQGLAQAPASARGVALNAPAAAGWGSGGIGGGGGGLGGFGLSGGPAGVRYEGLQSDLGRGPGMGGDQYEHIVENEFLSPWDSPYSTFSIDVDTAAYSKVRMFLMQHNQLPRPDAVRIEELINYFPYSYEPPSSDESAPPFAARMTVSECPWQPEHRLVRVGIKGKEIDQAQRPPSNLVFLLDVSGSMNRPNKLPLLVEGMKMLTSQLGENDSVSIVVYAGNAGMVLEPTTGDDKEAILEALTRLRAGGSTNGGAGIKLAYQTAVDNFIKGGVNRVILCTDGDFNVGVTGKDELVRLAEEKAKDGVFLTVLGFGMGNHNDAMLEKISNKGNGNYAFIDTHSEARKVLVEQMSSTLITIAKDVKIQVEFNPELVASYRLIGYENRMLAAEDFNDDTKDAGEIGAGHSVTAIYEIVPKDAENKPELAEVDSLKYQRPPKLTKEAQADELLTVKIRYKKPDEDKSVKLEFPLANKVLKFGEADLDFRFTAAVASFGMLLRKSEFKGDASFDAVLEIAGEAAEDDEVGYRTEFIEMVKRAKSLAGE